ncbi:NAD(P)-dependent oxidoreductase [Planctomicrobium sp. SH664]|uniref:NAD(P)-dependent oxidoreductase n=1 Tax=Planctomicrobium sp. SH664 TaxID=3448125 RepID=UPI003F5BA787
MSDRCVGVIGLGLMGTAISERFLERGYTVKVWNRTREKADSLIQRGAVWSENPADSCRRVVISLYSSDVVSKVVQRLEGTLRRGQFLVDTTTGRPDASAELGSRLASRGVNYLDAPISGSSEQTRRGEATVLVGGERAAFEACSDLWPVLGNRVIHVGQCGNAARMKLISNLVLGLSRVALAEGLVLAEAFGLDLQQSLEVMKASAAYSRTMESKGQKMLRHDYSVQARVAQHLKDVHLMLQESERTGHSLPMSKTHMQILERAVEAGWGELDNSAVYSSLKGLRPA